MTALGLSFFMIATQADQTCDDAVAATAPDNRFEDNGDGTVTDLDTGLIWKQCAEGLSGAGCATGRAQRFKWQAALQHAIDDSYSGQWRLPNKDELASLVERRCQSPAINERYFPNTSSGWFWSSSPSADDSRDAWFVFFYNGHLGSRSKTSGSYVRLVCEQNCNAPGSRFEDNGDGTVTDRDTGLVWKQCVEGLSGRDCATGRVQRFSWEAAMQHAVDSDSGQWRLPNKNELASLVEPRFLDFSHIAIDERYFPNTPSGWFWSSSTDADESRFASHVDFSYGGVSGNPKGYELPVRLVRARQ
ncbi:DUF1566 domain-containing protein [Halochromatium salexigens]|uniref:Lcl C-terminal domain-containing protein n=1 Tax=Halochromatium salexigens TaxID=49447 RepID=UPI001911E827|nr:DUF1566 domain-containing protein [Halochromatium salexigens]